MGELGHIIRQSLSLDASLWRDLATDPGLLRFQFAVFIGVIGQLGLLDFFQHPQPVADAGVFRKPPWAAVQLRDCAARAGETARTRLPLGVGRTYYPDRL